MKNLFLILFLNVIAFSSFSQVSFHHGLGGGMYIAFNEFDGAAAPGINYAPRLNFLQLSDELSLSVGTNIGLGISLNSREGASSLMVDLPLTIDFNAGAFSSYDAGSTVGGFAGAGFGYSLVGTDNEFGSSLISVTGPLFNAGFRAYILDTYKIGLRTSFLLGLDEFNTKVFSVSLIRYFGDY